MNILNKLFKKDNKDIEDLSLKVEQLEDIITKTNFSNTLPAVVGSRLELWGIEDNNIISKHYAIFRGINMVSDMVAQLNVKLYRAGNLLDNTILPNGFDIGRPNPNMLFSELLHDATAYLFYRGEVFIRINEDPFLYLDILNPKHMFKRNNMWEFKNGKIRELIPADRIIHIKVFNPDGDRGIGLDKVINPELINDEKARNLIKAYFDNNGVIGGIITDSSGRITSNEMEKVKNKVATETAGAAKAGKIIGLTGGLQYNQIAQTNREFQNLESRKYFTEVVYQLLGIHKSLVGITDQVNRSVAEEATRNLWQTNLKPRALQIQQKLNQQFMRNLFPGYTIKLDFSDIEELQDSLDIRLERASKLKELGYTTNEINKKLGLGMEDINDNMLDIRFTPASLVPIDSLILEPEVLAPAKSLEELETKDLDSLFEEKTITKAQRNYVRRVNRLHNKHEKKLTSKMRGIFSKQRGKILAILDPNNKNISIDIEIKLANIREYLTTNKNDIIDKLTPLYSDTILEADALAIGTLGKTTEPTVDPAIINKLTNRITGINDTLYKQIRSNIVKNVNEGATIDDIANGVRDIYKMSTKRATMIARTETTAAVNMSTDVRYKKEGVQKKQWVATSDNITRDSHVAVNGEIVGINEAFSNGLQMPGDPSGEPGEVVNCRCTLSPIVE